VGTPGAGWVDALRLVVAASIPLVPDEAYYWVWSRALAPGYPDHPPMVALWTSDAVHEVEKLDAPAPPVMAADHLACGDLQGSDNVVVPGAGAPCARIDATCGYADRTAPLLARKLSDIHEQYI